MHTTTTTSIAELRREYGYDPHRDDTNVGDLIAYKDAVEDALTVALDHLERVRGCLSRPYTSAADDYADVCSVLHSFGLDVYGYDDPANPYRED